MLRNRLTPNLLDFAASTLEEIEYALDEEFSFDRGIDSILFVKSFSD